MRTILGIDLGTSSVKAMLFDAEQGVIAVRAEEYGVDIAHPGWAQQSPALWSECFAGWKVITGKRTGRSVRSDIPGRCMAWC